MQAAPLRVLAVAALVAAAPAFSGAALTTDTGEPWVVGFHDFDEADLADGEWRGHEVLDTNHDLAFAVVEVENPATFHARDKHADNVAYTERDDPRAFETRETPDDPYYDDQYGFPQINADDAWDTTFGDASVKVGVVDSGVDQDHEDLEGTIAQAEDFTGDDPDDTCDHGTHVAGTVAANTDNGIGVAGTAGDTELLIAKALDQGIYGCTGSPSDIAEAIDWLVDQGADVISMSLGGSASDSIGRAVDDAWDQGVYLTAAAGNAGQCTDCVDYPAARDEVAAVTCTNENEGQCSFSSQGPEAEVAAPGNDIYSLGNDGGYTEKSGTSMSTPHVSGVAALALGVDGSLTNTELREAINDTAQDLGDDGHDNEFGHGETDARALLDAVGGTDTTNEPPTANVTATCEELTCEFDASASSDPDGAIEAYTWAFGDGAEATGATANHTYDEAGTYEATVTVEDDDGATDDVTEEVQVDADDEGPGLEEGFEDGDPGWNVTDASGPEAWSLTTDRAANGSTSMAIREYGADEDDTVTTDPVDVSGMAAPELSLASFMDGEQACGLGCTVYDYGTIEVSGDGGDTWTVLEDGYWDSGGAFEQLAYDLSDVTAEDDTLQVRFSFTSDGSVQNEGWYIDDVTVADAGAAGLEEGFEDGDPGWNVTDASGPEAWSLTTDRAANGSSSLALNDYGANEEDHVVTPSVDLAPLDEPELSLASWMEGEQSCAVTCFVYDYGRIQLSDDGGDSWTDLEDLYVSSGGEFEQLTYDLSDWTEEPVQIRFSFTSDGSVQNEGWYVDDVTIR